MLSTGVCRWLFLLISLSTWVNLTNSKEMRVVCYYTNWSVYRPGSGKFGPQNINPYLCTHLIYAFGGFTKENALKPFDKYQDIEKGGYAKFTGLKTYNKELKTLLAIGGWNEGSSRFSPLVASAERRKEFARNAIKFLRLNHFDGLDLDWEYPAFRDGGKSRDKDNYPLLVQELREEFDREAEKTGRPRLLLTMAVPAGIEYINKGFDVPKLTKYLDWMNILSYDFHSAFEPSVNHHAPLYPLEEENEYNFESDLNIDYAIKHYIKKGAEPSKLVLGIPTYGRSYTLYNPDAFEVGAPADGPGTMGEATRENGYLAYYEVCDYVKNQDWEVEKPYPQAMGPYAFKDNQWVGYDDEDIVRKKAHYVVDKGLGGIMFWSIDNDDFRGDCHGKPYPLIEAGRAALIEAYGLADNDVVEKSPKPIKSRTRTRTKAKTSNKNEDSDAKKPSVPRRRTRLRQGNEDEEQSNKRKTVRKNEGETSSYSSLKVVTPSYSTPAPPSTPELDGGFKCEDEGFYPHPKDCKKYFWCLNGAGDSGIVAHQFNCPAGLYFNKAADSCDYSQNVLCKKAAQKTTKKPDTSSTTTISSTTTSTTTPATRRITFPPRTTTTRSTTTTTTTEAYEDEEYEDDVEAEEEDDDKKGSEEDPRVIKELIELIKKAGGIEELEKQFNFKDNSSPNSEQATTKTPIISKSLYERVLSKAIKNTSPNTRNVSFRNSRGPQSDKTEADQQPEKPERGKLQYTSISRFRSSTSKQSDDDDEPDQVKEQDSENEPVRKSIDKYPTYTNIRRAKSNFTTTEVHKDRNAILGEPDEEDDEDTDDEYVLTTKRTYSPQYVNIRRQRPSTTEESSTSKYAEIQRGTTEKSTTTKEDASTTSKYRILRRTTTTTTNTPEVNTDGISTRSRINETTPTTTPNNTLYRSTTAQMETDANNTEETINDYLLNVITTTGTYVTDDVNLVKSETNESKISQPNLINSFPRKRPQLFEPRPFSKPTAATTRPPPIQVTKVSESPSEPGKPQRNVSFRSRGNSRFNANSSGKAVDKEARRRVIVTEKPQEENRSYRPSEIADLSSLTAVDFDNIKGLNSRTNIRRRRPSTTTTTSTTELPVEISQKRRRIHITSEDPTTESTNRFAHHNRKVIRRFRTTTVASRINPILDVPSKRNEVDDEIFEDATSEEEENIKLSESNIRENSEINGFRPDSKFLAKESFGKSSVFNDRREPTPVSSTEPNLLYRTRKIVRKLTPTESSKITDKETDAEQIFGRKRKVIRKIRPINAIANNTDTTKLSDPNESKPPKRTFNRYRPTSINLDITTPRNVQKNKTILLSRSYRPTFKPNRNYITSESPHEPDTTTPNASTRKRTTTTQAFTETEITTSNDLTTENGDTTSTDYTTTEHNPTESNYTDLEITITTESESEATSITTESESEATSITTEETTTSGVQDETTTLQQIIIQSTEPSSTSNKLFYNIRLRSTTSTTQPSVEKLNITNEISNTTKVVNNRFNRYRSGYRPSKKINITNTPENTSSTPTSKLSYKFKKPQEDDAQEVTSEKPKSRFLINKKTRTTKPSSLPYFTKSTTETTPVINEELKNIDTDAVKNRNKSLFSKNRKPNPLSSTTQPSTISEEAVTDSMELSTEHPTTLVHIFAEKVQNATTTEQPDKINQNQTTTSRIEKLIEVNRIINVKTTEDVIKNHHLEHRDGKESSSLYDKIGSISRITVIKVVDKDNNTDTVSPIYIANNQSTESPIKSSVDMIIQIAKIQQVPPPNDTVNVSVRLEEANPSSREERRYDVIGIGKVDDSKSTNVGKAEIIDGISHINIITPRPAVYLTESSTIALEGLFPTDKPTLFAGKNSINEELLETDNSKYVNVRILHPDGSSEVNLDDYKEKKIIPIKLLKQDEDDAIMRARVVEVSPKTPFNTIRIVPIRVEAAKKPPPPLPLVRINRQHN